MSLSAGRRRKAAESRKAAEQAELAANAQLQQEAALAKLIHTSRTSLKPVVDREHRVHKWKKQVCYTLELATISHCIPIEPSVLTRFFLRRKSYLEK